MIKLLKRLDILPGWKTQLTACVAALIQALRLFGVIDLTPDQEEAVNGLTVALIGLFLALKIDRQGKA